MYAEEKPAEVARVLNTAISLTNNDSVTEMIRLATINSFGEGQWPAMITLMNKESRFDPYIVNQKSLACGLFQSLPCSKVGGTIYWDITLGKYRLDPNSFHIEDHINWGMNYIKSRYGTPQGALNFHYINNWY